MFQLLEARSRECLHEIVAPLEEAALDLNAVPDAVWKRVRIGPALLRAAASAVRACPSER